MLQMLPLRRKTGVVKKVTRGRESWEHSPLKLTARSELMPGLSALRDCKILNGIFRWLSPRRFVRTAMKKECNHARLEGFLQSSQF